jgi:hypothetical protein
LTVSGVAATLASAGSVSAGTAIRMMCFRSYNQTPRIRGTSRRDDRANPEDPGRRPGTDRIVSPRKLAVPRAKVL